MVGNRIEKTIGDTIEKHTYNAKNQLTQLQRDNVTTGFFYDNQGNLTREEAPDGTSTFGYDALNRQIQAVTKDGNTLVSRYDAEGLRAEIEENKKLTKFLYHNGNILTELDKDYTPKVRYTRGNSLVASTLWNEGNNDVEYRNEDSANEGTKNEETYYYHQDRQGSTIHITDAEENIQNSYRYDAFGMFLENRETIPNRITYAGQQYDSLTGQYYLRTRYYNPVIGRFTQEDPYRGDGTVYAGRRILYIAGSYAYSSKNDKAFKRQLTGGSTRSNEGWIIYQYKDNAVNTSESIGKKPTLTQMLLNMKKEE
jgi:RHS repeat-associated protein